MALFALAGFRSTLLKHPPHPHPPCPTLNECSAILMVECLISYLYVLFLKPFACTVCVNLKYTVSWEIMFRSGNNVDIMCRCAKSLMMHLMSSWAVKIILIVFIKVHFWPFVKQYKEPLYNYNQCLKWTSRGQRCSSCLPFKQTQPKFWFCSFSFWSQTLDKLWMTKVKTRGLVCFPYNIIPIK